MDSKDVSIVRELPMTCTGANQVLVAKGARFFVVSSVNAMFTGPETLVFPADENGEVTSRGRVAGGRGYSREEAIDELRRLELDNLETNSSQEV